MNRAAPAVSLAIRSAWPDIDHETMESLRMGMARVKRAEATQEMARPMRGMFDLLATGEVDTLEGHCVMRLPIPETGGEEWVFIAHVVRGWIDCWKRLAPDLSSYLLSVMAERLDARKDLTPRLVEQAREEFEAMVRRFERLPDETIKAAISTTKIAWEFDRLADRARAESATAA